MQDKEVTVSEKDFDLSSDDFKDVKTLTDLESKELFPDLEGNDKLEAESNLFNLLYRYQHNVDGDGHKVMTAESTINADKKGKGKKKAPPATTT